MADAFSIKFDMSGMEAGLDKISDKAGEFVRPAAQAGAQVLYGEAKLRVPVSPKGHWFHGTQYRKDGAKYWFDSGTLKASIYHVYSKDNSTNKEKATYHISWNHRKAPYGFMVEYGTSKAPAHPFIRPAYDAAKDLSLVVANDKFASLMVGANIGVSR